MNNEKEMAEVMLEVLEACMDAESREELPETIDGSLIEKMTKVLLEYERNNGIILALKDHKNDLRNENMKYESKIMDLKSKIHDLRIDIARLKKEKSNQ